MNDGKKNGYALSRQWFDFTAETSEMVNTIHTALYFWIVDLNNRLNWKDVIGLATDHTMNAIRIKSYRSYKKALDDLIRWGFLDLVGKSTNQHTCNQVALVLKAKAKPEDEGSALDLKAKAEAKAEPSASAFEAKAEQAYINSKNHSSKPIKTPKGLNSKIVDLYFEIDSGAVNTDPEQNLRAASELITILEKNNPGLGPDDTLVALRVFFEKCVNISDNYLHDKVCLPFIVKEFNRYKKAINQPQKQQGATGQEIAAMMARKHGSDSPLRAGSSPDLSQVDSSNRLNEQ